MGSGATTIQISLSTVDGVLTYGVQTREASSSNWSGTLSKAVSATGTTVHTAAGLMPGTAYELRVHAVGDGVSYVRIDNGVQVTSTWTETTGRTMTELTAPPARHAYCTHSTTTARSGDSSSKSATTTAPSTHEGIASILVSEVTAEGHPSYKDGFCVEGAFKSASSPGATKSEWTG